MNKKNMKKAVSKADDQENPEWTRKDFARAVPMQGLPKEVQAALSFRRRGPQEAPKKVAVSIRLSPEVVKAFRASGAGWQTRVDEILRSHIK
jgi:uncharacterized protein (DUF4415 family)